MAFDTTYPNRKDRRKPYHGSKACDRSCRPGGDCPHCESNRKHAVAKQLTAAREQLEDILVIDHGTIVGFIGQTEEGRQFLTSDVESEGYQWLGAQLCVDHRYAGGLVEGIRDNGLTVGVS